MSIYCTAFGLTTIDDGKEAEEAAGPIPLAFPSVPALKTSGLTFLHEEASVNLKAKPLIQPRRALGSKHALPRHSAQPGVCFRPAASHFSAKFRTRSATYPRAKLPI